MKPIFLLSIFLVHTAPVVCTATIAPAEICADIAKPDGRSDFLMYAPWRASYASKHTSKFPSVFEIPNRQQAE